MPGCGCNGGAAGGGATVAEALGIAPFSGATVAVSAGMPFAAPAGDVMDRNGCPRLLGIDCTTWVIVAGAVLLMLLYTPTAYGMAAAHA